MTTQLTPPDKEAKKSNLQPPDADLYAPQKSNLRRILIIAFTLFALLDIAIFAYIFLSDKAGKQPELQEQGQPTQQITLPEPETSRTTPEQKKADLPEAKNFFVQAQQPAPEFLPAIQAHARVQEQLEGTEFNQAMGKFLLALQDTQTTLAKTELNRAAQLRPNDPAVLNGNKQLQQLILLQNLVRLQQEYTTFAAAEQWQQALRSCEQALKLDSRAAFAQAGLQKATAQLALKKELQAILDHPRRLQEQGPLQEARQVLALADTQVNPGPRLNAQRAAVKKKIKTANRQIPVLLQSDNLTEVVIYRVGRLGVFNQRQLQLRPGRYTVVGSRPGYRDVRKELKIQADTRRANLRIRCTEVI